MRPVVIAAKEAEHVCLAFDGLPGPSAQASPPMRAFLEVKSLRAAVRTARLEPETVKLIVRGLILENAPPVVSVIRHKRKQKVVVCAVTSFKHVTIIVSGRIQPRAEMKVFATPTILMFQRKFLDVTKRWVVSVSAVEAIRAVRATRAPVNGTTGMHVILKNHLRTLCLELPRVQLSGQNHKKFHVFIVRKGFCG